MYVRKSCNVLQSVYKSNGMEGVVMLYTEWQSPIGPLTMLSTEKGICVLEFGTWQSLENTLNCWAKRWLLQSRFCRDDQAFASVISQLDEYFQGKRFTFDIPLQLFGTPFQKKVWTALLSIPYGETRSYKEIANAIAQPTAVRAVGNANNKNPIAIIIPCHRVIGSNGALVGYGGGIERKQQLLALEKASLHLSE